MISISDECSVLMLKKKLTYLYSVSIPCSACAHCSIIVSSTTAVEHENPAIAMIIARLDWRRFYLYYPQNSWKHTKINSVMWQAQYFL